MLLDIDAMHDMDAVSGSRRELVKAATVASQWPVLNFGNILAEHFPIFDFKISM